MVCHLNGIVSDPIKPYLPAIGRFLIVVTFLEDALRIITQWSDQLEYLHAYRYSKYTYASRRESSNEKADDQVLDGTGNSAD